MTPPVYEKPPEQIRIGDSAQWLMNYPDYLPTDGWSLEITITNSGSANKYTSTDNGDGRHLCSLAIADTTKLTAGDYTLAIAATNGTDRVTKFVGPITIQPDLTKAVETRSKVKQALDAIEDWMQNRTPGLATYHIQTSSGAARQLQHLTGEQLIREHGYLKKLYQQEVDASRVNSGRKSRRRLLCRAQA